MTKLQAISQNAERLLNNLGHQEDHYKTTGGQNENQQHFDSIDLKHHMMQTMENTRYHESSLNQIPVYNGQTSVRDIQFEMVPCQASGRTNMTIPYAENNHFMENTSAPDQNVYADFNPDATAEKENIINR